MKDFEYANKIDVYTTRDENVHKKYGIKQFPRIMLFRSGAHVQYQGSNSQVKLITSFILRIIIFEGPVEKDGLLNWLTESIEKVSMELDDTSFEHLTQASTGSTTGDWFILL